MTVADLYKQVVRPGDTCLDVGANVGQTARLLSPLVGPTGRCVSFEAEPIAFRTLAALAADPAYGNVEPHCLAISDKPGHDVLFLGSHPHAAQAATIVQALATAERLGRDVTALKVETDTLDAFSTRRGLRPALIKIDVEGAEDRVFAGACAVLADATPFVVFEFGYGFTDGQVPGHFRMLRREGYALLILDVMFAHGRRAQISGTTGDLLEISEEEIRAFGLGGNILAVPGSRSRQLEGITRRTFADVRSQIRFDTPNVTSRLASVVQGAEYAALRGLEHAYRSGRSKAAAGVRCLAHLGKSRVD